MLKDALLKMADVFTPAVLLEGKEYQQQGHVLNIRFSEGLLKARVKSSSGQIYDVHIDLKLWPQNPGRCGCKRVNCRHAAACFYALLEKEKLSLPAISAAHEKLEVIREEQRLTQSLNRSHDIVYLLEFNPGVHEDKVFVRLALCRRLKQGRSGKKIIFNTLTEARKEFYAGQDDEIISSLAEKSRARGWFERFGIRNSELIVKILQSGRAFLHAEPNGPPLTFFTDAKTEFHWEMRKNGRQYLLTEVEGIPVNILLLDQPWFYAEDSHVMGLLDYSLNSAQLKSLLSFSPLNLGQESMVARHFEQAFPDIKPPELFEEQCIINVSPVPVLFFDAYISDSDYLFVVKAAFDYEGIRVFQEEDLPALYYEKNQILYQMNRDKQAEQQLWEECRYILALKPPSLQNRLDAGESLSDVQVLSNCTKEEDLQNFQQHLIPLLKSKGYIIEYEHSVYAETIEAENLEWVSDVEEKSQDFFSWQPGIIVDGVAVSIVPLVADLIGRLDLETYDSLPEDTPVWMPLPDGRKLKIAMARIKPLIHFLLQFGSSILNQESFELSRYQLVLMHETGQAMAATSMRWKGGDALLKQMRHLFLDKDMPEVVVPRGLKTSLRDYQHAGLNWLQFLRQCRLGGILADDMGLGKTVQTLAHLQLEKEMGRLEKASLIIAPTSLMGNWFEEAKRFTPELKVLVFHGTERQGNFDGYDLVISTYGLIQRDKSRFVDYLFYYLILDEAQFIKNARAKTTQIIQQIKAQHRLCLSGTPLENHLGELWSLFHFLMPGLLGEAKQFRQFFKVPIEKHHDADRRQLLANRVRPFMLRRSKSEVAKELPPKTDMTRFVELEGSQRDLYEAIRMSMESKVREAIAKQGLNRSHIVLLDALLKLRQVCCDPRLLSIPAAYMAYDRSAKLEVLMELLANLMSENRRVLIFSQFTSMLKLIEERLIAEHYPYLKLTGQTQNRQQLVHRFQQGDIPVFLISLKAGGTGLNLTRADTVIHYDPWWNPAAEDQATDRSHRIGQENPVFVYKLITKGTVEEAILSLQAKKRQLFEGILSESTGHLTSMTSEDIEQFFAPMTS